MVRRRDYFVRVFTFYVIVLEIKHIYKFFVAHDVLQDISLRLPQGEMLVLLGASGCGKTTLLRVVAGLERADRGEVWFEGERVDDMPAFLRNFGFVFQDYALFPHKNVADNVGFGLRMLGWDKQRIAKRVVESLAWVGLDGFERRAIYDLSGGEQQRVALARSLAPAPRLLLLDEPLGALDRALRERLIEELPHILAEAGRAMGYDAGISAIYVTHDQAEAFALGNQVAVMNAGKLEQIASPQTLYHHPATPFVARFLGMGNLISADEIGVLGIAQKLKIQSPKSCLLIRPTAAIYPAIDQNQVCGTLEALSFRGRYQQVMVRVEGVLLQFEFESGVKMPALNTEIIFSLDPKALQLL